MQTFARLVRACLGASAVAASKLDFGRRIVILGVEMLMQKDGVQFWPAPDKVAKWLAIMRRALREGCLRSGEASKLAGMLQWATQQCFRRLGRAMIRPIFDQIKRKCSAIGRELELALRWWIRTLQADIR